MYNVKLPSGRRTSSLGFGCTRLMTAGDEPTRQRLLAQALDAGITHFDTAPLYGLGRAEAVLGRFLAGRRDRITVATKFGLRPYPLVLAGATRTLSKFGASALVGRIEHRVASRFEHRFSVVDARASLERSLRTLNTDHIDLLLLHDCSPADVQPELVSFLDRAVRRGQIGGYGVGTGVDAIATIHERQPRLARAVQINDSLVNGAIDRLGDAGRNLIVTHGAVGPQLDAVRARLAGDKALAAAWSNEVGCALDSPAAVTAALISSARHRNPQGIVLFSTTCGRHLESNVAAAATPVLDQLGAERLRRLVQQDERCFQS